MRAGWQRVAPVTPQQRSTHALRDAGYTVQVVEQTIRAPGRTFKRDLWGFADLLAIRTDEVLAVQVTSSSNLAARVRKITESEHLPAVRAAGIRIEVHGWVKRKEGWQCRITDMS